jgi:glycyl-tRNA synthetase
MKFSGKDLQYQDPATNEKYIPWILETSVGLGRLFLAVLSDAYTVEQLENGESRTVLKLNRDLAPVKVAVSPLLRNKPELVDKAKEVYAMLKKELGAVMWDDNGNIGKRYRRQDEIGTPICITIDFQTLEDNTVTVRDRDTAQQHRVKIEDIAKV